MAEEPRLGADPLAAYYKKAYGKQKNHTQVRQFLGYEQLEHRELLNINELLKLWSNRRNRFCVTMKKESKRREGSRQIQRHEKNGSTPGRRLIDSGDLRKEEAQKLEAQPARLNPFIHEKGNLPTRRPILEPL